MAKTSLKAKRRSKLKKSIRGKLHGTAQRPRLSVFRSNKHIYAQLIDDVAGHTLASASTQDDSMGSGTPIEQGGAVGKLIAQRAKDASIDTVTFDRNGYRYHGRVKALADGAREGGLQF